MTREEPIFKKCCYCVPLRLCLQTWACLKLAADIICFVIIVLGLIMFYYTIKHQQWELTWWHFFASIATALTVDAVFMLTLIVGVCKKSIGILGVFIYYGICMMVLEICILGSIALYSVHENPPEDWEEAIMYVIMLAIGLPYLLLDLSIVLTAKSELIKIRNKEQYDFVRLPSAGGGDAGPGEA